MYIPYSVLPSFPRATSSRVYTQWHMAQSLKPSLWPLVTGIHPIPSAGSVYDDLVLFLHAFTPLITFGLICNSFHFACFVNSSLRLLIPNLHPICTCSCLFTPLTEGRSARDLTQAATSQKKVVLTKRTVTAPAQTLTSVAKMTLRMFLIWRNLKMRMPTSAPSLLECTHKLWNGVRSFGSSWLKLWFKSE